LEEKPTQKERKRQIETIILLQRKDNFKASLCELSLQTYTQKKKDSDIIIQEKETF